MMIKRILLLFALAACLQNICAQAGIHPFYPKFEKGYIEFKDGRIIKANYLYSPEFDKVRIATGKESFVVDASQIVRITKKKPGSGRERKETIVENRYSESGKNHFFFSELGVLPGNPGNPDKIPLIFHTSVNYNFFGKFSAGMGAGVEFYKETYLPVSINGLYKFRNTRVTPFAGLQVGYQVPIEGSRTKVQNVLFSPRSDIYWPGIIPRDTYLKAQGGILLNPSLGVIWQSQSNVRFTFSAGYRFHRLGYYNKDLQYNLNVDYRRLSLKLGLIF